MKKTQILPPKEYLDEAFTYDPLTGDLFWKVRPLSHFKNKLAWGIFNSHFAGKIAGNKSFKKDGSKRGLRLRLSYNGHAMQFYVHRIIFPLMGCEIPDGYEIDHKSTDPFDNRWNNLRLANLFQNGSNRKPNRNRKHPLPKGVHKMGNKFQSVVISQGKRVYLGVFDTPEDAHAAYCAKATELHQSFARFN